MSYAAWLVLISVVFVVVERLAPRRPDPGMLRRGLATDLFYVAFNGHLLGVLLWMFYGRLAEPFGRLIGGAGIGGIVHARAAAAWPLWLQFVSAFLVIDLIKWAIHNLLHRVPALWRIHQVHHSIETMDWLGSMRFHFGEALIYDALLYLPLAVLGFSGEVMFALAVAGTAIGHFNHANLRVSIGPLRYLINSPEMHVWHHVHPDAGPVNRNFGINLSLWDWIFGTAFLSPDGSAPARLGFAGIERFPADPVRQTVWPVMARTSRRCAA